MKKPLLRIAASSITLACFLASCGDNIVDPDLPVGAAAFTPPTYYATWWEMTKACSGRPGSLSDVEWYTVPGGSFFLGNEVVSAYWSAGSNRIVLSEAVMDDGQVVRHEMLHALLGDRGHAREDFLRRCAGYVTCTSQCVEDAGPAPEIPATVPRVTPAALEITVITDPLSPKSSINGGYFALTVRARNPASNPVFVQLPGSSPGPPVSFSYQIFGNHGEARQVLARDPSSASFAPGETKIHTFDFLIDDEGVRVGHLFPGTYNVTAAFGGQVAPVWTLFLF